MRRTNQVAKVWADNIKRINGTSKERNVNRICNQHEGGFGTCGFDVSPTVRDALDGHCNQSPMQRDDGVQNSNCGSTLGGGDCVPHPHGSPDATHPVQCQDNPIDMIVRRLSVDDATDKVMS